MRDEMGWLVRSFIGKNGFLISRHGGRSIDYGVCEDLDREDV